MYKASKITFLIFIALIISLSACNENESGEKSEKTKQYKIEDLSEESVYNLESVWQNQNASDTKLIEYSGKPTVMAMIYTHCAYSCPKIVEDMKQIHSMVPDKKKGNVNFLLVSIDPKHDKPDTLKQFMAKEEMDEKYWSMVTSNERKIRELAAVLGFKYKKTSLMDYAHSNIITLLGPKGEIVHQIEGFGAKKEEFVEKIIESTKM